MNEHRIYPLLAYVSGPYSDSRGPYFVRENIAVAERMAARLWMMGVPNICPHKNTALMDGIIPHESWIEGDLVMVDRCDIVIMLPRWECSSGACKEHDRAKKRLKPIFYAETDDFEDQLEKFIQGYCE